MAPRWLVWLRYVSWPGERSGEDAFVDRHRYTMFYPLYPIGISAEWWLMYRSISPAGRISTVIPPIFLLLPDVVHPR